MSKRTIKTEISEIEEKIYGYIRYNNEVVLIRQPLLFLPRAGEVFQYCGNKYLVEVLVHHYETGKEPYFEIVSNAILPEGQDKLIEEDF